jgi:hypothetical protein
MQVPLADGQVFDRIFDDWPPPVAGSAVAPAEPAIER